MKDSVQNLHEEHVSCVVSTPVYCERLLLHEATAKWLQIYVIAMLVYTQNTTLQQLAIKHQSKLLSLTQFPFRLNLHLT